jgi:hypothetical protein
MSANLETLKRAIAAREGFGRAHNVPSRTNNPGDLLYRQQRGATPYPVMGQDGKTRVYAQFRTVADGWAALEAQIRLDAARGETLEQFIEKYAPASDANDPASYLSFVMRAVGLQDKTVKLAELIA